MIPYEVAIEPPLEFPPLPDTSVYVRPPLSDQTFVPDVYPDKIQPAEQD